MLKKAVIFTYCLLSILGIKAQVIDLEKLKKDPGYFFFNGSAEELRTSSHLKLDSVLSPSLSNQWTALPDKSIIFRGLDPYYYWYRFSIRNLDSFDQQVILLFSGKGTRSAELWQYSKSQWISYGKTGYQFKFKDRPYPFPSHSFLLTVPAKTVATYYLDVDESHAYKTINLGVFDSQAMDKLKSRLYLFMGFMVGVMLLFALLNIYLYFALKEDIHIWYAMYIIFTMFFVIKHDGLDMQFLGLDSSLGYRSTSMAGFVAIGSAFLIHVIQLFLVNIKKRSLLGRAMTFCKWSLGISGMIYHIVFLVQPPNIIDVVSFEWSNKSAIFGIVIILSSTVYSIYKGYKPAWILLVGQSFYLIGALMRGLFISDFSPVIPPSPMHIGILIEVIVISFALMHRYNLLKKEKDKLTDELSHQQREFGSQILATQENEQKRIAADLHDELGGNLAAIKMTVQRFHLPDEQESVLKQLIDNTSHTAREIAHNLMPPDFEKTDFVAILEHHFNRLNTESNLQYHFFTSPSIHIFSKTDELMMYRILMELTTNIEKHANAKNATIQLVSHAKYLEMMVEDDGKGFNDVPSNGIGLKNVRSRVNYLGGTINIDSGQKGTTIVVQIPYKIDV